jgi:hypothetical protein
MWWNMQAFNWNCHHEYVALALCGGTGKAQG